MGSSLMAFCDDDNSLHDAQTNAMNADQKCHGDHVEEDEQIEFDEDVKQFINDEDEQEDINIDQSMKQNLNQNHNKDNHGIFNYLGNMFKNKKKKKIKKNQQNDNMNNNDNDNHENIM